MPEIIIITKFGEIECKNTKCTEQSQIFKLCNYKTNTDFKCVHTYNINDSQYSVYGKEKGRANSENKYEFPPPIDSKLFFGTMCIFKSVNGNYENLSKEEWENVYEALYGGFDDINSSEEEERSMDSEIYDDNEYTKEGYLKDDFIVDDEELIEEGYISE